MQGLLTVEWEAHTTTVTRYRGGGRPSAQRETFTETQVRYVIRCVQRNESAITAHRHRLGWRVQVTNAPAEQLTMAHAVVRYRAGCVQSRLTKPRLRLSLRGAVLATKQSPIAVWRLLRRCAARNDRGADFAQALVTFANLTLHHFFIY